MHPAADIYSIPQDAVLFNNVPVERFHLRRDVYFSEIWKKFLQNSGFGV